MVHVSFVGFFLLLSQFLLSFLTASIRPWSKMEAFPLLLPFFSIYIFQLFLYYMKSPKFLTPIIYPFLNFHLFLYFFNYNLAPPQFNLKFSTMYIFFFLLNYFSSMQVNSSITYFFFRRTKRLLMNKKM